MDGAQYDINVNSASITDAVSMITSTLESLEDAVEKSNLAASEAVEGFGGSSTLVGSGVSEKIQAIDSTKFENMKTVMSDMIKELNKVQTNYDAQEQELLKALESGGTNANSVQ